MLELYTIDYKNDFYNESFKIEISNKAYLNERTIRELDNTLSFRGIYKNYKLSIIFAKSFRENLLEKMIQFSKRTNQINYFPLLNEKEIPFEVFYDNPKMISFYDFANYIGMDKAGILYYFNRLPKDHFDCIKETIIRLIKDPSKTDNNLYMLDILFNFDNIVKYFEISDFRDLIETTFYNEKFIKFMDNLLGDYTYKEGIGTFLLETFGMEYGFTEDGIEKFMENFEDLYNLIYEGKIDFSKTEIDREFLESYKETYSLTT